MSLHRPESALDHIARLPRGGGVIRSQLNGRTLEILIDHPQAAGAVSPGMMVDLVRIADDLSDHAGRPIVIHGSSSKAFCAGGDLRSVRAHLMNTAAAGAMLDLMTWALERIGRHRGVVIGAVEGVALGGGAELLTTCDEIILSSKARVGFVHAGLGVSPGWGGAGRLVERVGRRHALRWLADPRPRSAEDCLAMGMADRVVAPGTALETARKLAAGLAKVPRRAAAAAAGLVKGLDDEREAFLALWGGSDHQEALESVRAGR